MLIRINKLLILGALLVGFVIGCRSPQHHESSWANEMAANTTYDTPESRSNHTVPAAEEWVCPMHPRFKLSHPGKCSICGMDLVRSSKLSDAEKASSGSGHSHSSASGQSHSSECGSCR